MDARTHKVASRLQAAWARAFQEILVRSPGAPCYPYSVAFPVIDTSRVVEEILRRIHQGSRRIALVGAPSSGKTTALGQVAQQIASDGWSTLRTLMPSGDDAGPLALTLLADQVGCGKLIRDASVPWSKKLEETVAATRKKAQGSAGPRKKPHASGVLVTLDDPQFEQPAMTPTPFTEHATSLIGALSGIDNVAFIVASSRRVPQSWGELVELEPKTDAGRVLAAFDGGPFAAAAKQVKKLGLDRLATRSPAEVRLLVAIEKLQHQSQLAFEVELSPLALLQRVLDVWGLEAQRALRGISVLRTPFDDQVLDELLEKVPASIDAMIRSVIVHRTEAGWVVPEIVARAVRPTSWQRDRASVDDPAERRGHEVARAYHQRAFARAAPDDVLLTSIRHELEELHHLTQLHDAAAIFARSVYFVDYYDALGKRLGQLGVRSHGDDQRRWFGKAVTAYQRALDLDETDAYAHHYLAYNVDWLATDAARAETHYVKALELRPDQVWHHGRWISFLVTRGRILEARDAWAAAMKELGDDRPGWIFDELHRQVARLLLHRGELDFAKQVLDGLSGEAASSAWARAERRLYDRLDQAARDQLVFPSSVDPARPWDGPHLVHAEGRSRVKRWWAGRVETWLDGEVVLRLAERPGRFGRKTLPASEFRKLLGVPLRRVPAGTFLELVQWPSSRQIFVHPGEVDDVDLPPVLPSADRYLRRAAAASLPGT